MLGEQRNTIHLIAFRNEKLNKKLSFYVRQAPSLLPLQEREALASVCVIRASNLGPVGRIQALHLKASSVGAGVTLDEASRSCSGATALVIFQER